MGLAEHDLFPSYSLIASFADNAERKECLADDLAACRISFPRISLLTSLLKLFMELQPSKGWTGHCANLPDL